MRLPGCFRKVSKQQLQITAVEPALKHSRAEGCLGVGFSVLVLQGSPTRYVLQGFDLSISIMAPNLARTCDVTLSFLMSDGLKLTFSV